MNSPAFDHATLAAFVDVMGSSSLTLSGRRLGITKSTLSRRLSQLETQLGQPLLRRHGNRLLPTEAGHLFLEYARDMLRLAEQSSLALDDLREAVSGEVVVKVHPALSRGWMAAQARAFLDQHPQTNVSLRLLQAPPVAPDVQAIQVWLGELTTCGLRQESLGALSRGVYAHPDYLRRHGVPAHPSDIAEHTWVDLLGDTDAGMTLSHAEHGDYYTALGRSRLRVDQHTIHADAIVNGQGLGLMPHWMAQQRLHHHPGTLVAVLEAWHATPQPVTLLYPHGHLPGRLRAMIEQLRAGAPSAWQLTRDTPAPSAHR
ncbi:LysR family transcriptional regulator [Salinicola aestuarinus]|uniref:LysR family transcriptional regulator n=1 Tax=Salinicola aestuarinus TaxID=1949082 RepID=UPI000DA268B9|nr:LysR family transcriptional regulator [Salinicola aestuarinus]